VSAGIAWRYWRRRLLRRLWARDAWLLVRHHPPLGPPPLPLPPGYRLLAGEELRVGYPDQPARDARIRRRLADARQVGLGLAWQGRLAYDTWIWRGPYREPATRILLDPGPRGGVLLDSWTAPAHRGRGLHAAMLLRRLDAAREMGLDPLLGLVHLDNAPALAAQRGAGAEALMRYVCRRLLGVGWRREEEAGWHDVELRAHSLSP
jgi:GNAT superfamily N-acetyltransferase